MASTRTLVVLVAGLGGVIALASGASASVPPAAPSSKPRRSNVPRKRGSAAPSSGSSSTPKGEVTLGPITTIKTSKSGAVTKSTDLTSLTPKERAAWDVAQSQEGRAVPGLDLLTDEQAYAMERAGVEAARANLDPSNLTQQQRAKIAAQKARELLGGKRGATGVPKVPANPSIDREPAQERGEPLAYISPPTHINLEAARKEAGPLATHLRNKGRAGYSRQSVRAFQGHAGITVDGIYGPWTRSALVYFGVKNPPAAMFVAKPGTVTIYAPAN